MLSERIDYSTVIWTHDSPDAEQHAATRNEYSPHFAERSRSVRKELKTLLTHDDIKRGAREVPGHGAAFHPCDGRARSSRQGARHGQHARAEIHARGAPRPPHGRRANARDPSRAAGPAAHATP